MELIHISQRKNRQSILKNRLKPTYVKLDYHREIFNNLGLGDNVVFTWVNNDQRFKYIKDLIFVKNWLHPRNEITQNIANMGIEFDMRDFNNNWVKIDDENIYDVYLINDKSEHQFTHSQDDNGDENNTTYGLPDEYTHFDKTLHVFNKPLKYFQLIESVKYRINKRGKYSFKHISK